MIENLIKGIVYIQFDDVKGTVPSIWFPQDLDEQLRMLSGIKAVSLLTGEQSFIPKTIVSIPFPSRNLKGMLKFLKWNDKGRRGDIGQSAIILLFHEADDLIFYKAKNYLESLFRDVANRIIILEKNKAKPSEIQTEINLLRENIYNLLADLKEKELSKEQNKAFPTKSVIRPELIDFKFKIVVCGDPHVGKTSTILRFTRNAFKRTYIPTLGVNISEKTLEIDGNVVELVLWDIAGQSKFNRMRTHFYQGAEGVLLVFDLTESESFNNIKNWYQDIKKNTPGRHKIIGFIIGNKSDLENRRKVSHQSAVSLASQLNLEYIETSALTGENIQYMFETISKAILNSLNF
ncbi:MAG: GTP-binding protein [Candidatus Lokiarchaeota archaeon]|nr:GTP-binding protein [Candidatus Lokiarchaeota archaeon]MBD3199364.1 GTP-binding protein [Candidatus Lokiarchaeota archaeon]